MSTLFWVSYALLWLLVAVLAVAVLALYHHFGQMYLNSRESRADPGPERGRPFTPDKAVDLAGNTVTLPLPDRPALVLFASTTCPICAQLRDHVARISAERPDLPVVVFCEGTEAAVADWAGDLRDTTRVVADPRRRHAHRHDVAGTPVCVAVARDGTVRATAIVNGYERLAELADAAVSTRTDHQHERVGSGQ